MHIGIPWPAEFVELANTLNLRFIYSATSSACPTGTSNLLLKLRLICHFYHLICPPNQLLYFMSPSQLHPSSCSNQKDSSWTPPFSHLYSIIRSIIYLSFVFILCFPKLGPKLLKLLLSSSSLPSMSLLIWPCYNRSYHFLNILLWMFIKTPLPENPGIVCSDYAYSK